VHFKGSGFYSTDYGRGKKKAKEGEAAAAEKSSEKPAEQTSGEKKPKPSSDST
jgi:hypothetical protein